MGTLDSPRPSRPPVSPSPPKSVPTSRSSSSAALSSASAAAKRSIPCRICHLRLASLRSRPSASPPPPPSRRWMLEMASDSLTSAPNTSKLEQLSRALSAAWSPSGANLATGGNSRTATEPSPSGITRLSSDLAEDPLLALVRTGIENDFEEVVFHEHPSLRSTKRD